MEPPAPPTDLVRFRLTALGVLSASLAVLVAYAVLHGPAALSELAVAAAAVFLSKLAIFGGNLSQTRFDPWELGLIAWTIDVWVSCALLAGIASFERLPLAGRALAEAHGRAGATMREYPGLRRLAFWGIAVLVFLPIPGSGAVTGTLVGRLVGLSRLGTLASVAAGAGAAVACYAAVAVFLGSQWEALASNPLLWVVSLLVLIGLSWCFWHRVRSELLKQT
ncbi:MAG: small multi-drug export protein [Planctomycetes bacterium]|nr:small multi-drug export protein [Planctomycetota bacterium]